MISIQCECGKKLKVKDELAGKRVRCPECSEPLKVPAAEADDGFLDDLDDGEMEDEGADDLPKSRSRSSKSTKKTSTKKSRRNPGSGITFKKIFGLLSLTMGVVMLVAMVIFVFSGDFQPKKLRALVIPFVFIGMGWAWIQGKTYGGKEE